MYIKIYSDFDDITSILDLDNVRTFTYTKTKEFNEDLRKMVLTNVLTFYWRSSNVCDIYYINDDKKAKRIINKVQKYLLKNN